MPIDEIISKIIFEVAILFIMMLPGVILKKTGLASEGLGKGISNLVLYVAQPALIFLAYMLPYDEQVLINSIYVFAFSVLAHVIFTTVALSMYKKSPDNMRRMLRFATIFANAAFMGVPLIKAVFEEMYPGATLYASIYNITFNLFLWSIGVYICTDDRDEDGDGVTDGDVKTDYHEVRTLKKTTVSPVKVLLHPVTIAAALGLMFFILKIPHVILETEIVYKPLSMLGDLVAPLAMLVIGLRLPDIDFHGFLKDRNMYLFLLLRHLALPLSLIIIFKIFALFVTLNPAVELVVIVLAAAPAASSATMFAEKYDCDTRYVSRLVTVSTLLSVLTMPLMLLLL